MKLDWCDVEELAAAALKLPDGWDSDDVTNELDQQFGVSFEQFQDIVEHLI